MCRYRWRIERSFDPAREQIDLVIEAKGVIVPAHDLSDQTSPGARAVL